MLTQLAEVLDPRDLVPRGSIVLAELGLDDDLGVQFTGDDEVRCLVEVGDSLCPLRLPEADLCPFQFMLDGVLDQVADDLAD